MEKKSAVRRKAQKLAREGRAQQAADEMGRILEKGSTDPYDFVFYGDLLVRAKRLDDAFHAFQEAMNAYEKIGLYRNAIAVGKKILRADPSRARTYSILGELYSKEGLIGDAVNCYLIFLDRAGGEVAGPEFIDTLEKVAEICGTKVEVALRLAELYLKAGKEREASQLLEKVAQHAEEAGSQEIADHVRERAAALIPRLDEQGESLDRSEPTPFLEPMSYDASVVVEPPTQDEFGAEEGAILSATDEIRAASRPAHEEPIAFEPSDRSREVGSGPVDETPFEAERFDASALSLDRDDDAPADASPTQEAEDSEAAPEEDIWQRVQELWEEERWSEVIENCERLLEISPDQILIAEKLVAASRRLGDRLTTVRYLTTLGDLRITEEDLEGALECFLEVLHHDPQNTTARRRLARFREMNVPGSERIPKDCQSPIQAVIESGGATVSVKESGGIESDEWADVTTLLNEFREGVRTQVGAGDHAGHYDLGLSHMEMGLFEEALEEFDQVLMIQGLPAQTELKTREMRGTCLRRIDRSQDAIVEYRAALDVPDCPETERNAVRYQLASTLQEVGEVEEARAIFHDLTEVQSGPADEDAEAA